MTAILGGALLFVVLAFAALASAAKQGAARDATRWDTRPKKPVSEESDDEADADTPGISDDASERAQWLRRRMSMPPPVAFPTESVPICKPHSHPGPEQ